ncbi:MAG: type II secretion system F family protein [Fimbriimonadaceae bacterium]
MPVFEYRATNEQGEPITGTLHSASVASAAESLASQGLTVEHVGIAYSPGDLLPQEMANAERPRAQPTPFQANVLDPLFGKVPLPDLLFFFRQLASLQNAGVNLAQSLNTLSGQTRNEKLKAIIREMGRGAEAGRPMTETMVRYPEAFSPLIVSLVRAGEQGGNMDGILRQVAEYIDDEIELRRLYRSVTLYPKLVLGVSVLVIVGANWIIGAVGGGQRLYSPLTDPAILIPLVLVGLWFFFYLRVGLQNPALRYKWDRFILQVPVIGVTLKQLVMAKFGRAVGSLYKGGIPIHDAVQLGADACGNQYLRSEMYPMIARLKEGAGITDSFRQTGAFSPIVLDMTQTGEQTGNLDQMLIKMAEFYEGESKARTHQLAVTTGVVILLFVAIYVGYILVMNYQSILGGRMQDGMDLMDP